MSLEPASAGAAPASSTTLMPDVSPVSTPATNSADAAITNGNGAAKPTIDQDLRAVWDKLNPPRENGKFVAYKNGRAPENDNESLALAEAIEIESTADQPAEVPASEQAPTAEAKPAPAATPAIDAPPSWSAEMKAKLAALPPEYRDVIDYAAKRDKETHQAITRAGQEIKAFEPLRNVIEQFGETFQRNNLHPADGVARMLAMEQWLGNDPRSAISEIAKAYRVDLREIAGQPPAAAATDPNAIATPPGQVDPAVAHMQEALRATQAELRKVTSYLTEQQKAEDAAARANAQSQQDALARQIADFAKDKPHFEKVRLVMSSLMDSGAAETIDDAYEQATHANKDIRSQLQTEQKAQDEKRRAEESAKKLADAKRAGSINVKSTTGSATTPKTMDDTLREVARRHYS